MERLPFDPYDFFGYLAAGLMVVVGMDMVLGFPHVLGQDLKAVDTAILLLAIYIAGQLVATPAKAILEDVVVDKILGRPNVNLFRVKTPRVWCLLFPGFYKPLPKAIQARVLKKAKEEGIHDTGEALFLHVRYHQQILDSEKLMGRLSSFINQYGFARNLAFASFVVAAALLIKSRRSPDAQLVRYGWVALVGSVLLFYRYLKFFRQYSYEMFNTYAGLK